MFITWKNVIRHIVILLLSFFVLLPAVWLSNKSYYTSISKVNYWEEKQITELIGFALRHSELTKVRNDLESALNSAKFFDIAIYRGQDLILHKKLAKYVPDIDAKNEYAVDDYKIVISRRVYSSYLDDYKRYIETLFTDIGNLLLHQNFIILTIHLNILLILELIVVYMSIKYKLHVLKRTIQSNQSL